MMEIATVHKDEPDIYIHDDYCRHTGKEEIAHILLELSNLISNAYGRTEQK